ETRCMYNDGDFWGHSVCAHHVYRDRTHGRQAPVERRLPKCALFGVWLDGEYKKCDACLEACKDALDKPMQKPLTLQEAIDFKDITYLEIKRLVEDIDKVYVFPIGIDETNHNFDQMTAYYVIGRTNGNYLDNHGYNVYWRCWAIRPTDEEREAATWET
ncbi:MAG: hypothetical protein IKJ45_09850, partial [Kiritimatiellae bacterium]|nr:hypothetical protein [Kiritimatiellia bacterium]